MDNHPLVSVVMPVFKPHAAYLRAAIQSVLSQTLKDIELVIVEDPSECSGESVIREFADPRIRYYKNRERTSLVDQRNLALRHGKADLVACLDADDICVSERLQKQVDYLRQHPEVSVMGSQLVIIDASGESRGYRQYPLDHRTIVKALSSFNPLAQPSVMYRKEVVVRVGGYRPYPVCQDYELWCRLAKRDARFANHPEPLLLYRVHAAGIKATKLRDTIRATLKIKKMYWAEEMDLRGRARMHLERALLLLPPQLVLKLFTSTQYKSRPATSQSSVPE